MYQESILKLCKETFVAAEEGCVFWLFPQSHCRNACGRVLVGVVGGHVLLPLFSLLSLLPSPLPLPHISLTPVFLICLL